MSGYNFTERVRKTLAFARDEAATLSHPYVGTEHILLGLLRESEGVASTVLENLHIKPEALRQRIEETVKKGKTEATTGPDIPYTSRAKKVLELAMSEARDMGHSYVGTEHLLLGLLREENGIAAQVLVSLGVTLDRARVQLKEILEGAEPRRFDSAPTGELFVNGTARLLLSISAIPAWVIGVLLIFNAKAFEAPMGIIVDEKTATIAQAQGAILIGLGFINWLARDVTDRSALWAVLYGNFVVQVVSFAIVLRAIVQDLIPMAGMGALAMHVLLGGAFAWQALKVRRSS